MQTQPASRTEPWIGALDPRIGCAASRRSRRILLASRSPRRREFLQRAGAEFESIHPGLDDSELLPGSGTAAGWVMGLAYLKARAGAAVLHARAEDPRHWLVLGADTTCLLDGEVIGTPRDAAEAREMLERFSGRSHEVVTGVALVCPATNARTIFADAARVWMEPIQPDALTDYIAGGQWTGKAGAYNLSERISAGWKIRVEGDPTTIMGLPMTALCRVLTNPASPIAQP